MSLTAFVALPEVKQRLIQEFQTPLLGCRGPLRVPPRSKSYSLIGTAFDYLLRFWLLTINPTAEVKPWVAGSAVKLLSGMELLTKSGAVVEVSGLDVSPSAKRAAVRILKESKQIYETYLKNGNMTDEVVRAAVHLAQLDPIYRAGYVDPNLGTVEQVVIDELKELFSFVEPNVFRAKEFCALNPVFGEASVEVGGADADMVVDDMLIDVKTTKSGKLDVSQFHQLVGYYILTQIGGVNGNRSRQINQLAVYYSRYGELLTFPVIVLLNARFPQLVKWLRDKMKKTYGK